MSTQFKKIVDYSELELDEAVKFSVAYLKGKEIDFYTVLRGIDAYMERRKRKDLEAAKKAEELIKGT